MYYFNVSMMRNETVMPRILAEDTGAAELRGPMFCAKTAFKFRRPGWLHRKKASPAPCVCPPAAPPPYATPADAAAECMTCQKNAG